MSNHAHLVVRVDAERAQEWSQDEVLRRCIRSYDALHAASAMTGQADMFVTTDDRLLSKLRTG